MPRQRQPRPVAPGWRMSIFEHYLRRIQPAADNLDQVDQFWLNFLGHYFPQGDMCGVERERCHIHPRPRLHRNVFVAHVRPPQRRHRVVAVECRWFPTDTSSGWENDYDWEQVRQTLRSHMLSDWTMRTTARTTYGIVAVGDRIRFYYMSRNDLEGELRAWNGRPANAAEAEESAILNIQDPGDQGIIHGLLLRMRRDVLSGNNTY
ncbi:hypothetical protein ASPBRDRAFT_198387 [Aspergillus brasiliensis CBS 101740]|uniref:Uncharacterized protein n=1 Tax=Aspergillus brasiliensis (strain CBS 101740 / IMI 381727 / IBT 21946) TaxID=767769 RepID=A0A1L9UDK3_ASPBC|nr:hypothetical protein ASPBRDRAFT_198387 [Aspergillus brasiliensis CBS 101740]